MAASAFLLASAAAAKFASLNLCTDEYLLLLGRPVQIVSVSFLSQEPLESRLWTSARHFKGNRGSIEEVLTLKPTVIMTMGGGGRATALIAGRLHIQALDLPYATDLAGVARNLRTVATALGDGRRAEPWVARLKQLEASAPRRAVDSIWISGRGDSLTAGSLGTQWLRLAGLQQRSLPGGKATLETLLTKPPTLLIKSDYRSGQMSGGNRWLDNPIVRRSGSRQVSTDGRPWTCLGPLMIGEIERLRRLVR
ncbi:ABC transporter substrate-binding protein [Sphingomonas limnosediminicola]|uniref:ABC transporter substrate-binding protein n=1 Tax=Sphingomonas limnosediminicola TaxID=940133 RepID=A0ABP7KVB8_9SPHN